ncbi:MAG: serine hydrolase [Oscillospiraceae bacterium]|nr:serine hydrolase [Oscillospiraceae bacterium]
MEFCKLISVLDQLLEAGIPGYDCAVFYRHEPVFRRFGGYSDRETAAPMRSDLLYYIYSATKVVTVTGALQLVEQGKLALEDCLEDYLPEYRDMRVAAPKGLVPARSPIRIRDLFCMTAGLSYDLKSPSLLAAREKTGGRCPTREMMRALAEEPLLFHPGTRYYYGLCHDVLAAVIEVISGQRFGQYLEEHIFRPCGMEQTGFHCVAGQDARFCTEYIYTPSDGSIGRMRKLYNPYVFGPEYESGGAGLITGVDDYCRFQEALISGKLISPEMVRKMQQPHLTKLERTGFELAQLGPFSYGLGVCVTEPGCGLPPQFGWGGRAGALTMMDTDNQISMFYVQHVLDGGSPKTERLRYEIKRAVYEGLGIPWKRS